jgi:pimeloyl-ACP methyl ester carboxylesterase
VALTALLGGSVLAEKTGRSPKVLALHGWGRTRADWQPVLEAVPSLAVDLPGFGASPEPPEPWGSRDYAELLAPVLKDGGWTVVGHSFGGRVAVQLAAGWPESVDRLVTGVPLLRRTTGAKAPLLYRLAKRAHKLGLLSDEKLEAERRKHGSADYRAAQGVMRDTLVRLVNEDYRDVLAQVKAQTALVWGAHDTAAPLAMAKEAARLLPAATLAVSETSGHLLDQDLIALLRDAVRAAR